MKERKPLTKAGYIFRIAIMICFIIVSFAFLLIAAILQNKGYSWQVCNFYMFIGLGIGVVGAIIALLFRNRLIDYEADIEFNKISKQKTEVKSIENVTQERVEKACVQKFFSKENGYFCKTKFYLKHDFLHYFIKCVHTKDIGQTIDDELQKFEKLEFTSDKMPESYNKCIVLFVFCDHLDSIDLKNFVDYTKMTCIETAMFKMLKMSSSSVVVLVDKFTDKAYYVQTSKKDVYSSVLDMIKKLLH